MFLNKRKTRMDPGKFERPRYNFPRQVIMTPILWGFWVTSVHWNNKPRDKQGLGLIRRQSWKAGITFLGVNVRKERSRMAVLSLAALRRSLAKSSRSKKLGVTHHRRIAKLRNKQQFHFLVQILNLSFALEEEKNCLSFATVKY